MKYIKISIFSLIMMLYFNSCVSSCGSSDGSDYLGEKFEMDGVEKLSYSVPIAQSSILISNSQISTGVWSNFDAIQENKSVAFYDQYNPQQNRGTYDIFRPKDKSSGSDVGTKLPLLIMVHCGAFVTGSKDDDLITSSLCVDFTRQGFATARINYRLLIDDDNFFTAALSTAKVLTSKQKRKIELYNSICDVRRAVNFFKTNANRFNIDPNNIYLVGYSAGAIASLHAVYLDDFEAQKWIFDEDIDLYHNLPAYPKANVKGIVSISGGLFMQPANVLGDNEHTPLLLIHGDQDEMVPYTQGKPMDRYVKYYKINAPISPGITIKINEDGQESITSMSVTPYLELDKQWVSFLRDYFTDDMYGSSFIKDYKKDYCTFVSIEGGQHYFFCNEQGNFNENYFSMRNHILNFIIKTQNQPIPNTNTTL